MARIIVSKSGLKVFELNLQVGKEYLVGRGDSCDICLTDEPTLSRQHLKIISHHGGSWTVEVLSRYGEMFCNEERVSHLDLAAGTVFQVPPYEFEFEETALGSIPDDFDDKTRIGETSVVAQLKLIDEDGNFLKQIQLDGERWTVGRDLTCTIFVDNSKISRRQFEISKEGDNYLIKDLNSSNGTFVNNKLISHSQWSQLKSGDFIKIANWKMIFEIRDEFYERKMLELGFQQDPPAALSNQESEVNSQPAYSKPKLDKKILFRIAIVGILLVAGVIHIATDDNKAKPKSDTNLGRTISQFDQLKPEHKTFVRQTYTLAKELFMQGKYEMSRQEILKIQQFVPYYEDSKEIEAAAVQAIQLKQDQERLEAEERQKIEIEEKIQKQIKYCRAQINSKIEAAVLDECLSSIIHFNPEHPGIQALKHEVDELITNRNIQEAQRADYQERVLKLKSMFDAAIKSKAEGKELLVIAQLQQVVRSNLPDPNGLKLKAKQMISETQNRLNLKQEELLSQAKQSESTGDLKSAILVLRKAIEINPANSELKNQVSVLFLELKKQMQVLYQEGILEESVGEVETAKSKWKKIIDRSLPDEEYYKKAKLKLKKYGVI